MSRLIKADDIPYAVNIDHPSGEYDYAYRCEIDALPTVDAQVWTLCKERLPEANGRYLVTRGLDACGALWNRTYILNYSDLMGLKSEKIWWSGNPGKNDFEKYTDVLAWMELPKAYGKD